MYIEFSNDFNVSDFITPDDPAVVAVAQTIVDGLDEDTPFNRLVAAYDFVATNITYVNDEEETGLEEVWQFPNETLELGTGDCEDISFLLASLLKALGLPARVAIGWHNRMHHAWVVGGNPPNSGILDATLGEPFVEFAEADYTEDLSIVGGLVIFGAALWLLTQ